jgi:hypothetical protein
LKRLKARSVRISIYAMISVDRVADPVVSCRLDRTRSSWSDPLTRRSRTSILTSRHGIIAAMAGYVVIRITERLQGGEPLRTAYAVAEANQHRAIALFKLRPDHTADERVEAVVALTRIPCLPIQPKPGNHSTSQTARFLEVSSFLHSPDRLNTRRVRTQPALRTTWSRPSY